MVLCSGLSAASAWTTLFYIQSPLTKQGLRAGLSTEEITPAPSAARVLVIAG